MCTLYPSCQQPRRHIAVPAQSHPRHPPCLTSHNGHIPLCLHSHSGPQKPPFFTQKSTPCPTSHILNPSSLLRPSPRRRRLTELVTGFGELLEGEVEIGLGV